MRPPIELPDPVRVDNLWDLKADPGRISAAATAWRTFAARARASHEPVDRHAGQLQGDMWAGDTAETYHWHLGKFNKDVDLAASLADQVAGGLDGAAAILRRGQDLLSGAWSAVSGAVSASVYHDKVTFRPRDDAQVARVHAAVKEANGVRADVDHELSVHVAAIDRTRSDWRTIAQAGETVARGIDDGWKLPPESTEDPTFIVNGDEVVLNTGPGNDRVTVQVDPANGEQVVTVNGRELRFPAGSHLTVRAGDGDDSVVVEKGTRVNLTLLGGKGDDNLSGGEGDDTILGLDGKDTVGGGAGNDRISLGASRDPRQGEGDVVERALGGDGDDVIAGSLGRDAATGGGGTDRVFGGEGDDAVAGNEGDDVVAGGGGTDNVYGNADADRAFGGAGRDYVDGGAGNDMLDGGLGDDTVYGLSGDDRIAGGAGNDYLEGASGRDDLDGGLGNDIISGGRDDDTIRGGDGNDTVYTGAGRDHVEGGAGQDKVYGQTKDTSEDVEQTVTVDIKNVGSYIKIEGSPEFVERVQADLDMLRASPRGQLMLGNLEKANDDTKGWFYGGDGLTIRETTDENSYALPNEGWFHDHPAIEYNPSLDTVADGPPVVVLYHEMAHVYDFVHDTTVDGRYNGASGDDRMLDEHGNTVNVPNSERQAVGLPIDDDGTVEDAQPHRSGPSLRLHRERPARGDECAPPGPVRLVTMTSRLPFAAVLATVVIVLGVAAAVAACTKRHAPIPEVVRQPPSAEFQADIRRQGDRLVISYRFRNTDQKPLVVLNGLPATDGPGVPQVDPNAVYVHGSGNGSATMVKGLTDRPAGQSGEPRTVRGTVLAPGAEVAETVTVPLPLATRSPYGTWEPLTEPVRSVAFCVQYAEKARLKAQPGGDETHPVYAHDRATGEPFDKCSATVPIDG